MGEARRKKAQFFPFFTLGNPELSLIVQKLSGAIFDSPKAIRAIPYIAPELSGAIQSLSIAAENYPELSDAIRNYPKLSGAIKNRTKVY